MDTPTVKQPEKVGYGVLMRISLVCKKAKT
jgi:hypothetical protein